MIMKDCDPSPSRMLVHGHGADFGAKLSSLDVSTAESGPVTMRKIAIATGLILFAGAGAVSAETPQCPSEISARQELASPQEGWRAQRRSGPHRHAHITLYDGVPEDQASLVPDRTLQVQGGELSTWNFGSSSTRGIWIECHYAGTSISLIRELPAGTKSCSVASQPNERRRRVQRIDCS
jgi:hypothetical protein